MNLDTIVRAGHRPWLPNPLAKDLDVWESNDAPTLGVFGMGTCRVLFANVTGAENRSSTWAYLPLSADVASRLAGTEFDDNHEMWRHAEDLFRGHEIALAHSDEHYVLDRMWMAVHCDKSLYRTALRYLEWVIKQMRVEVKSVTESSPETADFSNPTLSAWVLSTYDHIDETQSQYDDVKRLVDSV